jgi:hypothetical protein
VRFCSVTRESLYQTLPTISVMQRLPWFSSAYVLFDHHNLTSPYWRFTACVLIGAFVANSFLPGIDRALLGLNTYAIIGTICFSWSEPVHSFF